MELPVKFNERPPCVLHSVSFVVVALGRDQFPAELSHVKFAWFPHTVLALISTPHGTVLGPVPSFQSMVHVFPGLPYIVRGAEPRPLEKDPKAGFNVRTTAPTEVREVALMQLSPVFWSAVSILETDLS